MCSELESTAVSVSSTSIKLRSLQVSLLLVRDERNVWPTWTNLIVFAEHMSECIRSHTGQNAVLGTLPRVWALSMPQKRAERECERDS